MIELCKIRRGVLTAIRQRGVGKITDLLDGEIVEPVVGRRIGAGLLAWAQAGNRKIISRRIDLRYLAMAASLRKLNPEYHVNR